MNPFVILLGGQRCAVGSRDLLNLYINYIYIPSSSFFIKFISFQDAFDDGQNLDACSDSEINNEVISDNGNYEHGLQTLKGMFPTLTEVTLRAALSSARNDINMAVDFIILLDDTANPDSAIAVNFGQSKCFLVFENF